MSKDSADKVKKPGLHKSIPDRGAGDKKKGGGAWGLRRTETLELVSGLASTQKGGKGDNICSRLNKNGLHGFIYLNG